MLTERAVTDYLQCPQLLREPKYQDKRVKDDRANFSGWMDNLREALIVSSDSRDNVHVTPRGKFSYRAAPYQNAGGNSPFWLAIEDSSFYLLSTINYVDMYRTPDRVWQFEFYRVCYRDFSKGTLQASYEAMFRDYLWLRIAEAWESLKPQIRVISVLKDETLEDTTDVSEERAEELRGVFAKVYEIQGFMDQPQPNYRQCDFCFWKDCPERNTEEADELTGGW